MIGQIGITGGIGSGKSTVARIFGGIGYRIYEADARARMLTQEDPEVIAEIKAAFGGEMYDAEGNLDRARLAGIVFKDPAQLQILNSIVHPATARDFTNWLAETPPDYAKKFVIKEAAILFETGGWKQSDGIITVYAPQSLRIERVMKRDQVTEAQVLDRMANQWPDAEKFRLADFVVYNDGIHPLIPQVMEAIRYFDEKFS
ncbi:MAG: dephospho-CoA kinase [Bacteroidia bacterium]|nr:dephospho-CoA kinase [Bacteroidia bacterium]